MSADVAIRFKRFSGHTYMPLQSKSLMPVKIFLGPVKFFFCDLMDVYSLCTAFAGNPLLLLLALTLCTDLVKETFVFLILVQLF